MVGSAVIFIAAIIAIIDIKCAYDIDNWWAPLYPNGETVEPVKYDLLRPRAWGETYWTMITTDDVETVKQFYREKRLETLNAVNEGKPRGIAIAESNVQPLENGQGSRIVLYSECGL